MLTIDRSKLDKAIKNMVMFTATKEVLANYEAERKVLEERETFLTERLAHLQEQHTTMLMDRESAKGNPTDYISLSTQLTKIDDEVKILLSLQDQLKEEFTALKMEFAPTIRTTYIKDVAAKSEFDVIKTVDYVRYELIQAIADYAREVRSQDAPLMPAIGEFLDDAEVMEENRSFQRTFEFDRTNLHYSEFSKSTIARQDIFSACAGGNSYSKPKDVE